MTGVLTTVAGTDSSGIMTKLSLKQLIEGIGWALGTVTFAAVTLVWLVMVMHPLERPLSCDFMPMASEWPDCSDFAVLRYKLIFFPTWIGLTALGIAPAIHLRRHRAAVA